MKERIPIGSDHAGFELKQRIKEYLEEMGYEAEDLGTFDNGSVDYPDFAGAVAERVASGRAERGIVICGTGIGVSIAANKVPGVRAALATNVFMAEMARRHNNANVLALGGRVTAPESARPILEAWLNNQFEGGRHQRRIDKIAGLEKHPDDKS